MFAKMGTKKVPLVFPIGREMCVLYIFELHLYTKEWLGGGWDEIDWYLSRIDFFSISLLAFSLNTLAINVKELEKRLGR